MILDALPIDRDDVIQLLRLSHDAAGFVRHQGGGFSFPFDPAYAERLFLMHLVADHLCLILKSNDTARGLLMAACAEHPFGPVKIARETVWFIEPGFRGSAAVRMLDRYESWAHLNGCRYAGMAGMGDDPDVGKLYLRRGYFVAERHFLKAV
jgi:hypothetical protein